MRVMNKKVVSFLILYIGAIVIAVILSYELSNLFSYTLPPDAIETSFDELCFSTNISVWENKKVAIEGILWAGKAAYFYKPPPYNCILFEPNPVNESRRLNIGVLWHDGDKYSSEKVIVVGVVRKGVWESQPGYNMVDYYIEAQVIHRIS